MQHIILVHYQRRVHSQHHHTTTTVTGQVMTQIWTPMSSPQQIVSSTVTCSCFPRVSRIVYDMQLLHESKEDEATLVSYMYNS
jgi:hypothetical protein